MIGARGYVHAGPVAYQVRIGATATTILAPLPRGTGCAASPTMARIEPNVGAAFSVARVLVLTGTDVVRALARRAVLPGRACSIAAAAVVDASADIDTSVYAVGLPGGTDRDGGCACVGRAACRGRPATGVAIACRGLLHSGSAADAVGATAFSGFAGAGTSRCAATGYARRHTVATDGSEGGGASLTRSTA